MIANAQNTASKHATSLYHEKISSLNRSLVVFTSNFHGNNNNNLPPSSKFGISETRNKFNKSWPNAVKTVGACCGLGIALQEHVLDNISTNCTHKTILGSI